jgi:hypothetical protein
MREYYGIMGWSVLIAAAFYLIGGLSALKLFLILTVMFVLPTYLIISNLFPYIEQSAIISLFISLGVMPSLTYALGFFLGIRIAALASALILIVLGLSLRFLKSKKQNTKKSE